MLNMFLKYLRYNRLGIFKGFAAFQLLSSSTSPLRVAYEVLSSDTCLETRWNSNLSLLNCMDKESESALLEEGISTIRVLMKAIISLFEGEALGEDSLLLVHYE